VQLPTSIVPHPQQCFMFRRWVDRNTSYFGNWPHWGRFLSCSRDFKKLGLDQNGFNHWLILFTVFMHAQNFSANCSGDECDTGLCASYGGTSVCYCPAGQSCDGECSGDSTSLLNGNQSCIGELLITKYIRI